MQIEIYSHLNGEEIVDKEIKESLLKIIKATNFKIQKGCANDLRKLILGQLKLVGWSDDFILDTETQISLTSSILDHVLCFQTGNMSRFYADLLKLQYVFVSNKAKAAFYLIPSKEAAKKIGSNVVHFDRFSFEMKLFKQIITIPTLVIGVS